MQSGLLEKDIKFKNYLKISLKPLIWEVKYYMRKKQTNYHYYQPQHEKMTVTHIITEYV